MRYMGEVGLDGGPEYQWYWPDQEHVSSRVLGLRAQAGGPIMTVQSRRAATQVLDMLAAEPVAGSAILHWPSGTQPELARAVELGCWRRQCPATRVLTETDG